MGLILDLAVAGRDVLCRALEIAAPCPEEMLGALASVPLPPATSASPPVSPLYADPLQDLLRERYRIEVPIIPWPAPPRRLVSIDSRRFNR